MKRVALRDWRRDDLSLLTRLLGDPEMTLHIGGPESPEQIRARHERYLATVAPGAVFAVVAGPDAESVGWVGYWETVWDGEPVWETGWHVLPEFQGQGIATAATGLALQRAKADHRHDSVHAFPARDNGPSNAVCRKLGFALLGEVEVEYPPGHTMRSNHWALAFGEADADKTPS